MLRRRSRFFWFAHGITAVAHAVLAVGVAAWLGPPVAVGVAGVVWLAVAFRLHVTARDPSRPSWVVQLVDEPTFVHWGGCVLGTLFVLVAVPAAGAATLLGVPELPLPSVAAASYLAGVAVAGWGVWGRRHAVRVVEADVSVPGLPEAFEGYRIVQLSDLHIGGFAPKARGLEWAALANGVGADLAVVTGDLVSSGTHYYRDAAEVVGALRAPDGVFVSLGNHDQWDEALLCDEIRRHGPVVLKNEHRVVARNGAQLVIAGIDDRYTERADLNATLTGRPRGAPTVLLSHYPVYFEAAAEQGVEVVLSGHTHGGQIGVPFLADRVNVATLTGQRSRGMVRSGASTLYVNAGLGTTGPPLRLGISPEIAVLVLRAEGHGRVPPREAT